MFAKVRKKAKKLLKAELYSLALRNPISHGVILYESFSGNGMLCNPEAIFQRLLVRDDTKDFTHIWVLNDFSEYSHIQERYQNDKRVKFVKYKSPAYFKALATSQYLINNATFPWEFSKREGQTYINTWHGTPLKKMGYDVEGGREDTRNIVRNFVQADFLLAANERMVDMYLRAYKMKNIFEGEILKTGYPRIDRQNVISSERESYIKEMLSAGIPFFSDKKVVLYAPTWRGESFYSPESNADSLLSLVRSVEKRLGDDYKVLLKVHQVVYNSAKKVRGLEEYLVPNQIPTNVVLGLADVLITDYSSIFFDYLALDKPIVFFLPDVKDYSGYRGVYDCVEDLPGKVISSEDGLVEAVLNASKDIDPALKNSYRKAREIFTPYEKGSSSDCVIDHVFFGKKVSDVLEDHKDGRESILIYLGGMRSNGITSSALNLLNNIDYERFDVTAFYSYKTNDDCAYNASLINDNVRLFPRQGGVNLNARFRLQYRKQLNKGIYSEAVFKSVANDVWDPEWRRCFGSSEFDYIVDFSGYGPLWDLILLRGKAKQHTIWMHNDLASDAQRKVNGEFTMKKNLEAVFSTYKHFGKLVSVSDSLAKVNKRKLSSYSEGSRFVSARNTIDWKKIKFLADAGCGEEEYIACSGSLRDVLEQLEVRFGVDSLDRQLKNIADINKYFSSHEKDGVKTFVTAGRLSPEKNHGRLIRAFAKVKALEPDVRLMIIGSGPLLNDLKELACFLGVSDSVVFTGQKKNPYLLMKNSDCFVMSSDYEGQPMVILEARVLGLPIVTTAFGSVKSSVPEGAGLIVECDVEALAEGMIKYLNDEVPVKEFNPVEYNEEAINEFYRAIGAG